MFDDNFGRLVVQGCVVLDDCVYLFFVKMRLGHLLRLSSRCVLRFSENVQVKVWNMCTLKMYTVYPFTPCKKSCCVTYNTYMYRN